MSKNNVCQVAVVQGTPTLFNKKICLQITLEYINKAAQNGAKLILFPESFIPGYPRGLSFGAVVGSRTMEGRKMFQQYWESALEVPGPEIEQIVKIAKELDLFIALGITEKDKISGTLFCTIVYVDSNRGYIGKHRKLKPTASERIIWGEGNGTTLTSMKSPWGVIGGLICWENYMPLARMALYQKGIHIYLAPTADSRETWQHTVRHIALEGRCFVLGSNQFMSPEDVPANLQSCGDTQLSSCRGGSVVIDPFGEILAGPLYDEEGILYADLDMSKIAKSKLDFDVIGHYHRPDVFQFHVPGQPDTI